MPRARSHTERALAEDARKIRRLRALREFPAVSGLPFFEKVPDHPCLGQWAKNIVSAGMRIPGGNVEPVGDRPGISEVKQP
jgi:hypothetical protein